MLLTEYASDVAHSPTLEKASIKTLRLGGHPRSQTTGHSPVRRLEADLSSESAGHSAAKDVDSEMDYDVIVFYKSNMLDRPATGFKVRFVPIVPGFQDQSGQLAIIGSAVWEGDTRIGPTYTSGFLVTSNRSACLRCQTLTAISLLIFNRWPLSSHRAPFSTHDQCHSDRGRTYVNEDGAALARSLEEEEATSRALIIALAGIPIYVWPVHLLSAYLGRPVTSPSPHIEASERLWRICNSIAMVTRTDEDDGTRCTECGPHSSYDGCAHISMARLLWLAGRHPDHHSSAQDITTPSKKSDTSSMPGRPCVHHTGWSPLGMSLYEAMSTSISSCASLPDEDIECRLAEPTSMFIGKELER